MVFNALMVPQLEIDIDIDVDIDAEIDSAAFHSR